MTACIGAHDGSFSRISRSPSRVYAIPSWRTTPASLVTGWTATCASSARSGAPSSSHELTWKACSRPVNAHASSTRKSTVFAAASFPTMRPAHPIGLSVVSPSFSMRTDRLLTTQKAPE